MGQVVEGIPTAYALHDLAGRLGIDMPVTENVYQVLEGTAPAGRVRAPTSWGASRAGAARRLSVRRPRPAAPPTAVALKAVLGVW